jgi:hypothetical protein
MTRILALGLEIGVNTAIFTVYRTFLMRGIDAMDNAQMVNISAVNYEGKETLSSAIRISGRIGITTAPSPD